MATIVRNQHDSAVRRIKKALDEFEQDNPKSMADVYRVNSASIRIRIVDPAFSGVSKGERHDRVWSFLTSRLDEDVLQQISLLLLFTSGERRKLPSSFMDHEFDHPTVTVP